MKKIAIILSLLLLASCAKGNIQSVSVDEFEKQIHDKKSEQLIDIRTPAEFALYRIEGATNIDFRNADFRKNLETLDKTKPVLLYCLLGRRTKQAMQIMRQAGFTTVYELNEGINSWMIAGKPYEIDLSNEDALPADEYNAVVSSEGYVLVVFCTAWSPFCIRMLPILRALEETENFTLFTINFDQNRRLMTEKGIYAVPRLIMFKDGEKIWEKLGEASSEEIMKVLK